MTGAGLSFDEPTVRADMLRWMERAVIGLNLCPFAKAVKARGQVHMAVSAAPSSLELEQELVHELEALVALPSVERDTTLLVVPAILQDFAEFNLFLADAGRLLKRMRLLGTLQIASFHPRFQFAGSGADDIGNFTNRAPYPTLHLLREASIERAVQAFPDAEMIYGHNIRTLQLLGHAGWHALGVGPSRADGGMGP